MGLGKSLGNGCLFVILAVFGLFILLLVITPSSSSDSYSSDSEIDAYTTSKRTIEKILKAPATSEFQSYDKSMISVSGNTYTIKGYVDSENSFGAKLRSYYTVILQGSAYNWTIESVVFDGEKIR